MTKQDERLPQCFVTQPFDGGTFDRRYSETIKPMGYDDLALTLGITTLQDRGFITSAVELVEDYQNSYDAKVYRINDAGVDWIKSNQGSLEIKAKPKKEEEMDIDDDIPF